MSAAQWIGRVVRPLVMVLGVVPLLVLARRFVADDFGANPAEEIEHFTGMTALLMLLASLLVTPLRRLSRLNALVRLRKPLGLWAFAYATLHLGCYLVFDQSLLWGEILYDVLKRPYITVGFSAWLILSALAVTSSAWAIRRLGKRWAPLHRLVYVAATLGILHFLWLVKLDVTTPVALGFVLVALFIYRLPGRAAAAPAASASAPAAEATTVMRFKSN